MECTDSTRDEETVIKQEDINILQNALIVDNKGPLYNNYKIIEKIGGGTFSKVYKVLHIPTNQKRVMNVLKVDTINYKDDDKTFFKEIEMLIQLDHPNIIKIYEYYSDDVNYYVITELAQGLELYEQIYSIQNYNEFEVERIMKQLFSAVSYIDSKGIAFPILKPDNIILEINEMGDLDIKIINFGTNKYLGNNTKLPIKVRTPYYTPPEVSNDNYNNKYDIWTCGVIMYVLLSGSPPDYISTMDKVKSGKFNFNGEEWGVISKEAKSFISRLFTIDQESRISAKEALKDPWFVKFSEQKYSTFSNSLEKLKRPFENIRKFNAKQKFPQATIVFLVGHLYIKDMVRDLRNIYKELDEKGNDTLTYVEIRKGIVQYYQNEMIAEKEMEEILMKIDQDSDGYIEYEEFIRSSANLDLLQIEQNLKMAFNALNKDGSGILSQGEIKEALGFIECSEKDEKRMKNIISEIDIKGDISFQEFIELIVKVLNQK
jgi:calcium-dependent protein kinase